MEYQKDSILLIFKLLILIDKIFYFFNLYLMYVYVLLEFSIKDLWYYWNCFSYSSAIEASAQKNDDMTLASKYAAQNPWGLRIYEIAFWLSPRIWRILQCLIKTVMPVRSKNISWKHFRLSSFNVFFPKIINIFCDNSEGDRKLMKNL